MRNIENNENLIMMSARKIEGLEQAQTQEERNAIYEREKVKSFAAFVEMYGCPFGNPDINHEKQTHPQVVASDLKYAC